MVIQNGGDKMKIKPQHYAALKEDIVKVMKNFPGIKSSYKAAGFSKERFAWSLLHVAKIDTKMLYAYLEDSHIQTALFKIIGNY